MAQDLERLVVSMSADFKAFEREMRRATNTTSADMKRIRAEAGAAGDSAAVAFDGAARGMQRMGTQAKQASAHVIQLRGQTGNLAAQFNDIGVQLAGGQSPFLIALQQGSQINQVLGGAGARGAVAALGGAFASLLNPVSLATIAIIALGGAAIQYFTQSEDSAEETAKALKEQAAALQRVADEWGDLIPAVRAYADEVQRATDVADIQKAGEVVNAQIYEDARATVAALADGLVVLRSDLELIGGTDVVPKISALQTAFDGLTEKVQDGTATAEDAKVVQDALAAVMQYGGSTAESFAASLGILANSLSVVSANAIQAAADIQKVILASNQANNIDRVALRQSAFAYRERVDASNDVIAKQERINSLTADQLELETETNRLVEEGVLNRSDAARIAEQTIAAEQRRSDLAKAGKKAGGGRDKAAAEAEREAEAVLKVIEALQFEQSLIGATDLEREKANALRRAGAAATDEQRAQIEALVTASHAELEALKENEEALERLRGLSRDVLGGMFEDLRDGAEAADVLANALNRVAESLVKAGIDKLVTAAITGGGNPTTTAANFISGHLYHRGGVVGDAGPTRSVPASLFANARRYHNGGLVAGEVPAILQRGETVLPKGAGSGRDVTIRVDVTGARGNAEIMSMVQAGVGQGLKAYDSVLADRVVGIVRDPRKRG